jgi:hypothetical protein
MMFLIKSKLRKYFSQTHRPDFSRWKLWNCSHSLFARFFFFFDASVILFHQFILNNYNFYKHCYYYCYYYRESGRGGGGVHVTIILNCLSICCLFFFLYALLSRASFWEAYHVKRLEELVLFCLMASSRPGFPLTLLIQCFIIQGYC